MIKKYISIKMNPNNPKLELTIGLGHNVRLEHYLTPVVAGTVKEIATNVPTQKPREISSYLLRDIEDNIKSENFTGY